MNRLVFDIECSGMVFDDLDEKSQESLLRHAHSQEEIEEEKKKTALWPVTGEVVAIGMLNIDTDNAKVYYCGDSADVQEENTNGVSYVRGDEKMILEWFWRDIAHFDQVITFNGRGFDAPYILFRSMVNNVVPTIDLMPYRYDTRKHCDLADQLSYYGATRRFSLHLYMQALGLTSPKDDGVVGSDVPQLFRDGEFKKIAQYCMRDVYATAELFKKWEKIQGVARH